MLESRGEYREVQFKSPEDIWVDPESPGREDQYITAVYDVADGTYSLTYHPMANDVTTNHFTQHHAVLALRDAGYSFPQIVKILETSYGEAHAV